MPPFYHDPDDSFLSDKLLVITISGPRGSGTLYAAAREGNGVWQYYTLAVKVDGQNQVIALR